MANKKSIQARKQKEPEAFEFPRSKDCDIGSAKRAIIEQIERKQGLIKINNIASYDGKGINISSLISCLHILADPTHRENRWSCLVEMVKYDNDIYLRIVPSIPLAVKEKWEATGRPPRQMATNDVQLMIAEILGRQAEDRPSDLPAEALAGNPYLPGTRFHDAFNLASDWIAPSELLNKISLVLGVKRKHASDIMHRIGHPLKNGNRSTMDEKTESEISLVKSVRIG